jgi:hypothetical protein
VVDESPERGVLSAQGEAGKTESFDICPVKGIALSKMPAAYALPKAATGFGIAVAWAAGLPS